MYKNRVENGRKIYDIPTLLSCEQGNSAENEVGKLKIYRYVILNFPTLDFFIRRIKEREFQKSFCRYLPYFYIYTLVLFINDVICNYLHIFDEVDYTDI